MNGKLNGFAPGSSAPAAFNAASFAAHMTRAARAANAAVGSAGASPKGAAAMPQFFANGSAKRYPCSAHPHCVAYLKPSLSLDHVQHCLSEHCYSPCRSHGGEQGAHNSSDSQDASDSQVCQCLCDTPCIMPLKPRSFL